MKKVLFVVEGYYKHNVPNTLCVERIIEEWGDEIQADILSIEDNEHPDTYKVFTISYNTISKNPYEKLKAKIKKFIFMPLGYPELAIGLFHRIIEIDSKRQYDAIIPVMNPAEAVEAVYRYKKYRDDIKFIIYEIDPNSNRYKFPKNIIELMWKYRSMFWEKKVYRYADSIIHMKTHRNHFENEIFKEYSSKTVYLDIPSFKIQTLKTKKVQGKIKLLYAGAFYPKLRNPADMFTVMYEVSKLVPIHIDIYTGPIMWNELKEYEKKYDFLTIHHSVPQSSMKKLMEDADVLLSLGNKESDYLPSKTLEYIGTLKPVIHFQQDSYDTSSIYFKKYKKAFIVEKQNDASIINQLVEYLKSLPEYETFTIDETLFRENTSKFSATEIGKLI